MDHRSGQSPNTTTDRLAALRSPVSAETDSTRRSPSRVRMDVLVGVLLILLGVALALYLRGGSGTVTVTETTIVADPPALPASQSLMAGEVLVAVALEDGAFPPDLRTGDVVRVIVSPNSDGEGAVRSLSERVVVYDVVSSDSGLGNHVITLRAPENVAVDLASSGPVHLAVVEVAR